MILQQLLSVSSISLFSLSLALSLCAPLSVICSYFGLLILRAETFCKCFHYASHVAKRQRRLEAEATLITLCLSLINFCRIYYLNAFMCVRWCACVWLKGASKIGTSFWSKATSLQKSIKSDTCESCKHPSHECVCACVCLRAGPCATPHAVFVCVCVSHFMLDLSSSCVFGLVALIHFDLQ